MANSIDGSVSIPATIMAIYQDKPAVPAPAVTLPSYRDLDFLKATPADVYGKSTFALRWRKSGDRVQHFVFRAMDTTLFLVDNARRINGDLADYTPFSGPKYDPSDVDAIRQLDHIANADAALVQYAGLTASQLFILANLAENGGAYTRLHSQPINEDDAEYQDQDPNLLLYSDTTIDGRGTNRYFYRVNTTGANGLSSEFGESTLPVEAPSTTPPPRPVITAINGGENQITIKWAKQPGATIAGYLLYRTQDKRLSTDWRRMELIKTSETDNFTVPVNGALPQQGFEFVDTSVIPRQAYFYGVVAVGLSDTGKHLKSIISAAKTGQAYDLTPPDPPIWDENNSGWVHVDQDGVIHEWDADLTNVVDPRAAIRLVWLDDPKVNSVLAARSEALSGFGAIVMNWQPGETFDVGHRFFIDKGVSPERGYTYVGKSKSYSDLQSVRETVIVITPAGE